MLKHFILEPGQNYSEVRLIGGSGDHEGTVYIRRADGRYGPIYEHISMTAANVICQQLGFIRALYTTTRNHFGTNYRHAYLARYFGCSGNEESLLDCSYSNYEYYSTYYLGGVVCDTSTTTTSTTVNTTTAANTTTSSPTTETISTTTTLTTTTSTTTTLTTTTSTTTQWNIDCDSEGGTFSLTPSQPCVSICSPNYTNSGNYPPNANIKWKIKPTLLCRGGHEIKFKGPIFDVPHNYKCRKDDYFFIQQIFSRRKKVSKRICDTWDPQENPDKESILFPHKLDQIVIKFNSKKMPESNGRGFWAEMCGLDCDED